MSSLDNRFDYNKTFLNSKEGFNLHQLNIFDEAVVDSIVDEFDTMEIVVVIKQMKGHGDNKVTCLPLLPKMFYMMPKVGEIVKVLIVNTQYLPNSKNNAYWVGPEILQLTSVKEEHFFGIKPNPNTSPSKNPDAKGVFPEKQDIAIIGRDNTDIIWREKNIVIRAGKHNVNNVLKTNIVNPAYIDVRIKSDGSQSSINMLADKINLIAHNGDFKTLIDDVEIEQIIKNASPAVKGDIIYTLLKLMIKFMNEHVHKGSNTAAVVPFDDQGLPENMLSKNIKLN